MATDPIEDLNGSLERIHTEMHERIAEMAAAARERQERRRRAAAELVAALAAAHAAAIAWIRLVEGIGAAADDPAPALVVTDADMAAIFEKAAPGFDRICDHMAQASSNLRSRAIDGCRPSNRRSASAKLLSIAAAISLIAALSMRPRR